MIPGAGVPGKPATRRGFPFRGSDAVDTLNIPVNEEIRTTNVGRCENERIRPSSRVQRGISQSEQSAKPVCSYLSVPAQHLSGQHKYLQTASPLSHHAPSRTRPFQALNMFCTKEKVKSRRNSSGHAGGCVGVQRSTRAQVEKRSI